MANQFVNSPAIGGGGSGTVTSVGLSTSLSGLTVSGSPVTTSGTIALGGTLGIAGGGTGQTSAAAAYNALSPMTTTGDIEYESGANTASRLPIGSSGQVLTVASGIPAWQTSVATQNVTGNTSLSAGNGDLIVFMDSTSAAFTITLPSPSANTLRRIYLKDITGQLGTNNVTVARNGSESIEGIAASYVLQAPWSCTVLISNGTNWFII